MRSLAIISLILLLCVPFGSRQARAEADSLASAWIETAHARVRLVAAPTGQGRLRFGIEFALADGWKTYWRSPGDAGLPPEFGWGGSANLAIDRIDWPLPERFSFSGIETFGYEGEIVLPVAAHAPTVGAATHISLVLDFLTCREICADNRGMLALDIPAGVVGGDAALIDRFVARMPRAAAGSGITVRDVAVEAAGKDAVLSLAIEATPPLAAPDVIVEGIDGLAFLAPQPSAGRLRLVAPGGAAAVPGLSGKPLTLTIVDRASVPLRAIVTSVTPQAPNPR